MTTNRSSSTPVPYHSRKQAAISRNQSNGLLHAPLLDFGEFCLDISNAGLYRAGSLIALTPKAFAVLSHLTKSRGRLVSKDELLDRAWAGRVVGDAALQVCIGEIRKALCDDRRNPKYIETVPKRGYRFIADVTQPGEPVGRMPAQPADFFPPQLVGRDDALARLEQHLDCVLRSQRRVVFINGEPGIGKTTVAKVFLERAVERYGFLTASGQCIDHQGTPEAYLPVLDALGRLCRTPDGDRVIALLHREAPMWLTQMPALLSEAERERLQLQLVGSSQERMLREMVEALEALASDTPLVLLLEDLQWSDHATLDLFAYLARRSEPARLLLLGTYRPVDMSVGGHPLKELREAMLGQEQLEEVPLELVKRNDIILYLNSRFPGIVDKHCGSLARTIHQHTNGNPLFMVNVVAHLLERGWLVKDGDVWRLHDDYSEQNFSVPQRLRDMLVYQLQRGSAEQMLILETASVAGVEFSTGELTAGLNGAGVAIEEACDRLAQNGQFIRFQGLEEWPDGTLVARYEFAHALYRDVLYERLAPVRRVQIHRLLGTRLEKAYVKEAREHAAQLATHFEQSLQYDKAIVYCRYAAETALRRHAHREAIAFLTKALQLITKLPETMFRDEQELQLQITLGSALMAVKGYAAQEVEKAYSRAKALCHQLGESPLTVQATIGLGYYYLFCGKLHSSLKEAEQLYSSVQNQKDQALLMASRVTLGTVLFYLGESTRARHHLEQGLSAYQSEQHRPLAFHYGQDFGVIGLIVTATLLWLLGFPDQARKLSQESLALAQRLAHPYSETLALFWSARVHHFLGEKRVAHDLAQRAALLSVEKQFAYQYAASAMMYGAESEPKIMFESLTKLHDSLESWRVIGTRLAVPYYLTLIATVYGELDQLTHGTQALEQALDLVEETNERWWEAEIHRMKGELLYKQGESLEVVEACFQKALSIARSQQAKSLELRAVMSLCRLFQRVGNAHQTSEMLRETYEWFSEGFGTYDLKSAASLLRQIA